MPLGDVPVPQADDLGALSEFCDVLPRIVASLSPSDRAACLMRALPVRGDILYVEPVPSASGRLSVIDVRALARHLDALARGMPIPGFEPTDFLGGGEAEG